MNLKANGKWLVFSVLILCLVALLVACGAPQAAPSATPTATPTATGPKYGGTLRIGVNSNPNALDPVMNYDQQGLAWAKLYSNSPLKWKGQDDANATLAPWFFASYEVSADGLTFTGHLQEGAKWQNLPPVNGREVTAADWKFEIERILDPKTRSPVRGYFASVDRIETPDKRTVKVFFKEPDPTFLINLASGMTAFIAPEVIKQDGGAGKTTVGVGPFVLKEFTPNLKGVFERNPDYWEKGKPYVDRVELYIMPEEASRIAAFRAGQIDRVMLTKTGADSVKTSVPNTQIIPAIQTTGNGLYMSIKNNPKTFGDVRVRKAVALAIDYDGVIQAAFNGAAYRSDWFGPQLKEWGARAADQLPKRDIAKAKALLAEAGFPNGFKANMITCPELSFFPATEPIAAMLKEIGIDIEIKTLDKTTFQAENKTGNFGLCIGGAQIFRSEPDLCLQALYTTKGAMNYSWYSNPRVDELYALQRKASGNPEQRKTYIKELFQILDNDQPMVPVCIYYQFSALQPWVKGWNNMGDGTAENSFHALPDVWLNK